MLLVVLFASVGICGCSYDSPRNFKNHWMVRMGGGSEVSESLATEKGYKYLGKVSAWEILEIKRKC